MKIRTTFVTNSSSSSFVVFMNDIPKDYKQLQMMMFGDRESIKTGSDWYIDTDLVAYRAFDFINPKTCRPVDFTDSELMDELNELIELSYQPLKCMNTKVTECIESDCIYCSDGSFCRYCEILGQNLAISIVDEIKKSFPYKYLASFLVSGNDDEIDGVLEFVAFMGMPHIYVNQH